ncbi:uncharacterized protein TNCV_4074311 [Trichonephila clavipes]|uniref:Uncharacterized protein n=1 Tax=Trichonephila clavipes TaxID=2585209 RepID=A0A8X6W8A2_TRICX|nr:uncharacterized protein TNCV_4074311 [Trichonephila clavipes]
MTAQRYVQNILHPHVLPLMQRLPGSVFQQDYARPHTARVSQDCLRTVTTLPFLGLLDPKICLQSSISGIIWDGDLGIPRGIPPSLGQTLRGGRGHHKDSDLHSNPGSETSPYGYVERFINTKLADMHLIYRLTEGDARAAEELNRRRYPLRDVLDRQLFANLHHNLCEYGSLRCNKRNEGRPRVTPSLVFGFF